MGCSGSKYEGNEAIFLCKERGRFVKQAIDSRYALSAAQLSYTQSLHSIGTALRKFAEFETVNESSLSTSEPDKSPSHSSYASLSPSRAVDHVSSPRHSGSPLSNTAYMRVAVSSPLKFTVDTSSPNHYIEEDSLTFPLPPPPPPPEIGFSWDFFNPVDAQGSTGAPNGGSGINHNFSRLVGLKEGVVAPVEESVRLSKSSEDLTWAKVNPHQNSDGGKWIGGFPTITENNKEGSADLEDRQVSECKGSKKSESSINGSVEALARMASTELSGSKRENGEMEKELCAEREDASKFITHRAKDFVSSMKDIEHRFMRAAECGHEVSRMLETNKISLSISCETTGKSSASLFLPVFHLTTCCNAGDVTDHDMTQHMTKVIIWNRSISSRSSSSRNPLISASKDDGGESGSDFIEEFCMISGSHSSTLDRLFAWERKLYDEVKASEFIRKAYDKKCTQLRHQFARDMKAQVVDKTRAVIKDLHSQLIVAIQAVDSISKRIEKLRDEELQPQLVELIQGLVRMWKAMLECHQTQYITISLAYHLRSSTAGQQSESYRQAIAYLQNELKCFASCFTNWVDTQRSYVEALSSWLEKCILPPQGRSWGRKMPFCPRRALAPPIFVLSRDLLSGINSLPSKEVGDAIKDLLSDLHDLLEQQREAKQEDRKPEMVVGDEQLELKGNKEEEEEQQEKGERSSNLGSLQTSLAKVFDQLGKYSEASVKVYEKVKQGSDTAHDAYINGRFC
ncbi:uncharacterized protein M6B38_253505 [Iris pallida]|uniref:Nitrate regulatory gene2 protein n=1 Tax=Iris pallida TaxID=29817 RepID=A0AAX6IHW2_IRIPA|nr:uncharacterized protein M6B38_196015 [Iris pallida]KAJ6852829.1 uncharacterized protein M6B38_253505 [Iris pallida]